MKAGTTQDNAVYFAVITLAHIHYLLKNAKGQPEKHRDIFRLVTPTGLVDVFREHGAYVCARSRANTGAYKIVACDMRNGIAFNYPANGKENLLHFRDGRLFCPESNRMVAFLKDGKPVAPWWGQKSITRKATTFDSSKGPQTPKFGSNQPGWWTRKSTVGNGLGADA